VKKAPPGSGQQFETPEPMPSLPLETRESLSIALEYAYVGVGVHAGRKGCHVDREPGCPLCDALTEVETLIGPELMADVDREWWVPKTLPGRLWWALS
jgi:hypothetical protein